MKKEIIVIIGGPSTGKSTLIEALKKHHFICYPEVSREIIREAQQQGIQQLFLKNPLLFSEKLLEGRIKQYEDAIQEDADIVFLDRGIPDILAYMDYKGDCYPNAFIEACKTCRYTKIFVLPLWKKIYQTDTERYETFEQAQAIQQYLTNTYKNLGYSLIHLPQDTVANRLAIIIKEISK